MALSVKIDGVDYIAKLVHESLVVHQQANRLNSTCSFDLLDAGVVRENAWTVGTTRVTTDGDVITGHVPFAETKVEVAIEDGGTRYFGGVLSRITVKPKYAVKVRDTVDAASQIITCHCHDYNALLEQSVVPGATYVAKTDEEIIDDIFDDWVNADPPNHNIDRDTHVHGGFFTLSEVFKSVTVREVMDRLANVSGYEWYVDYDKKLHYTVTGDDAPIWHLSDAPDGVNSYAFLDPISVETDATNLVNKVYFKNYAIAVNSFASIAKYGVRAVVISDNSIKTSADRLTRANALFDKFAEPVIKYTLRTYQDGLRAGMNLRLVCAHLNLDISNLFLIQKLTIKFPVDGEPIYKITLGGSEYSPWGVNPPPVAPREWAHDLTFTSADTNTVTWGAGTILTSDGQEFSIPLPGGTTGNMAGKTIVYLDLNVSDTSLQTTTDEADAIGPDRFIIAICWPGLVLAGFQIGGSTTTGDQLGVTATVLSNITPDMGTITAGEFRAYTGIWDNNADGFRLNADEFCGQENGVDQIIITATDGKLKAGAGAVVLDEDGLRIISDAPAGIPEQIRFRYDDAGTERSMGQVYSDWAGGAAQMLTWVTARREVGSPWPANISTVIAAIDAIAGTDVRLAVSSGGVVDVTGEDIFRTDKLLRPGTVANAAAEAALAQIEDGCLIYRLDTDKLRLRANGAWVDLN